MKSAGSADRQGGFFENLKKIAQEQFSESIDKVKFVLSRNGLYLEDTAGKGARFVTHQGEVEPGSYQWVSWATNSYKMIDDAKTNTFALISPSEEVLDDTKSKDLSDSKSIFYIQMPYGSTRPRVICNKEDPFLYTKLVSTTRMADGYENPNQSLWKIKKA